LTLQPRDARALDAIDLDGLVETSCELITFESPNGHEEAVETLLSGAVETGSGQRPPIRRVPYGTHASTRAGQAGADRTRRARRVRAHRRPCGGHTRSGADHLAVLCFSVIWSLHRAGYVHEKSSG
jgi:hypothetical protein